MESWVNLLVAFLGLPGAVVGLLAWKNQSAERCRTIRRHCAEIEQELQHGLPDGAVLLQAGAEELRRVEETRQAARKALRQRVAELRHLLRPGKSVEAALEQHLLRMLDVYECGGIPEHDEIFVLNSRVDDVCGRP